MGLGAPPELYTNASKLKPKSWDRLYAGQWAWAVVRVTNMSATPWNHDDAFPVRFGAWPPETASRYATPDWIGANRPRG